MLEVVGGLLDLVLLIHITVAQTISPSEVVNVVHALQVHGQSFEAVGDFAGDGLAVNTADLLEISELGDFHAIEPNFPAQAPGAQGGVLPIVFHKTDVVFLQIKTQRLERAQVQVQYIAGRRFQHHLVLIVVLQAVGVLAITTIFRATAGLHISGLPWLGAQGPQKRGGVRGASPNFHVNGLKQGTTLLSPVILQLQNDLLEGQHDFILRLPLLTILPRFDSFWLAESARPI